MNLAILLGRLGRDPELRYTQSGAPVCNVSLATSHIRKKDGERIEETEWHQLTIWQQSAENFAAMCQKGSMVSIEGSIRSRSFENKEGQKVYVTEINVHRWNLLKDGRPRDEQPARDSNIPPVAGPPEFDPNDDVPF
jgi:single-strand DNA-binding protein